MGQTWGLEEYGKFIERNRRENIRAYPKFLTKQWNKKIFNKIQYNNDLSN